MDDIIARRKLRTNSGKRKRPVEDEEDEDSDSDDDEDEAYATEGPPPTESVRDFSSAAGSSRPSSPVHPRTPSKGKQRDTWTRWPLLAGDVHVPEWSLADEVRHITEHALESTKGQVRVPPVAAAADSADRLPGESSSPTAASSKSDDEDEEDQLAMSTLGLQALTADAAAFLARVLALVAAHVPAAEKSMQNRVRPISWETVVDVACANGAISPRYVYSRITVRLGVNCS